MENKKTSLDDVLKKFSLFGRYHLQFTLLAILAKASNSLYASNYVFAAEESGYRCVDETFARTCGRVNGTRCTEWVYDDPYSFVAEFQLGCQEWKRTLVGTIYSFGYMLGLLVVGPLSDRIGRKAMVILTGAMGGVFGVARSFSKSYWLYIVLEFFGAFIGDVCSPMFVLNVEIVTAKKRAIYNCLSNLGFNFGGYLLALAAWGVPYWRNFLQTIYAPAFLFILYYFALDESPRWLLTKGKKDKAIAIVEQMGKKNKVDLNKDVLDSLLEEEDKAKGISYASLLKMTFQSRALLMRFVICTVWWTTTTFVNYGLTINSVSLQGNKYLNYALVQAVDFPGVFIIMYILTKYKRKKPLICSFFAAAIMCFIQPFVPKGYPWLSIMVYMSSKLMGSIFESITYMYTSELFPTYTRNSMHAMCSSIGRIGSIIAPQTPLLMSYWSSLPSLMFGGASLAAGLLTFLVPDTADAALPDTVREAEDIGMKKKKDDVMGNGNS